jgi:hypothetical protein
MSGDKREFKISELLINIVFDFGCKSLPGIVW